jgi:CubicO group peptidase (beta-lactamase class C family)
LLAKPRYSAEDKENSYCMPSSRRYFLKQIGLGSAGFACIAMAPRYYTTINNRALLRSTPEQQGVSSSRLNSFLDEVEKSKIEFHSIMVVRHGHVIAEGWWAPYKPPLKHTLYSLSKSFTSTAVGLAVKEGLLNIEDSVISFFPSDVPKDVNGNLSAMKVRHLLTMSTGHVKDTIQPMRNGHDSWARTFFNEPLEREPGTFFLYNTGATYMLSAILQKITGQTLQQYLRPRLFDPLDIDGEDWETDPKGINTGGYGLRIRTEDIAKFGQLYLQKGQWKGKQILTPEWIQQATSSQIVSNSSNPTRPREEDDWAQGYGFQFWRCRPGGYRADGAFGQFSIILPEYDSVIAITGESFTMQKSMDLVWSYLLPAIDKTKRKLPADAKSQADLKQSLGNLKLEPSRQIPTSPLTTLISGKEFVLQPNEFHAQKILLTFKNGACVFVVNNEKDKHEITCGINEWVEQRNEKKGTPFPVAGRMDVPTAIAGSVTWINDKTLLMTLRLIESCHTNGFTFIFEDNTVTVKFHSSISQGNPKSPEKRADLKGSFVV